MTMMETWTPEQYKNYRSKGAKTPVSDNSFYAFNEKFQKEIEGWMDIQVALPSGYIFIPGQVISSKNSKRIFYKQVQHSEVISRGKYVEPFITDSKATYHYKVASLQFYINNLIKFKLLTEKETPPYHIGFSFLRNKEYKFDYINLLQVVQDQMVKAGYLPDDSMEYIIPHFMTPAHQFHDIPGVFIVPIDTKMNEDYSIEENIVMQLMLSEQFIIGRH